MDLDRLFPDEEKKPGLFTFTFETAGREVSSFEGDFHLERQDNPENLIYRVRLIFTEPAKLA